MGCTSALIVFSLADPSHACWSPTPLGGRGPIVPPIEYSSSCATVQGCSPSLWSWRHIAGIQSCSEQNVARVAQSVDITLLALRHTHTERKLRLQPAVDSTRTSPNRCKSRPTRNYMCCGRARGQQEAGSHTTAYSRQPQLTQPRTDPNGRSTNRNNDHTFVMEATNNVDQKFENGTYE